jgi:uncharacterized protein (DUF2344 family)
VRLRVRFAKLGKVRYTSHRDVARIWERAIRRVGLPVVYTEGFSPRPKVSFGLALPTGYESVGEYLDISVHPGAHGAPGVFDGVGPATGTQLEPDGLTTLLTEALPVGMNVQAIELNDVRGDSLQQIITTCSWRFEIRGLDVAEATSAVANLLSEDELPSTRIHKGKERRDDIRPAVHRLEVMGRGNDGAALVADLAAKPRLVRPSELISFLSPGHEMAGAVRTHQWIEQDGARREPVPFDATPAPHTELCAS